MDERRRQAVQDWLRYRSSPERAGHGHDNKTAQPLSMDEIRRRAVEAWQSLRARGSESQASTASGPERDEGRDRGEVEQARDTPGLGDDFSG